MSAEQLAAIAGVILSLAFSYIPGLSDKWAGVDATKKRLIMGGLVIVVAGAAFGLSCGNILQMVTCDKQGAMGLVNAIIAALIANQAMFMITKG
jgi:hypothetical protein